MIIPIKTFEEMTKQEQRQHIESLIEDCILGEQNGNLEFLQGFLNDAAIKELKHRTAAQNRGYFTPREIAEKTGRHPDTIRRLFWHDPGVIKRPYSGRNRKTYTVMLISRAAVKRRFPDLELERE
jgi:hypothetical protein